MTDADRPGPDAPRCPLHTVLEPHEGVAEVLFGLIMVLTFTGSLSIADAGRDDVRAMLLGALGCNFAWGLIDGVLYLMGCLAEKGKGLKAWRGVLEAPDPGTARGRIARELPPVVASLARPEELDAIRERMERGPRPPDHVRLDPDDWKGAGMVFLLVFLSTLPVVVPFVFMARLQPAMRVSNAIAVAMLFIAGTVYGRCIGRRPWRIGLAMVALGLALSAITMALGG